MSVYCPFVQGEECCVEESNTKTVFTKTVLCAGRNADGFYIFVNGKSQTEAMVSQDVSQEGDTFKIESKVVIYFDGTNVDIKSETTGEFVRDITRIFNDFFASYPSGLYRVTSTEFITLGSLLVSQDVVAVELSPACKECHGKT